MNTDRIKYIREKLQLTQTEMAENLGCTRSAYLLWEINKNVIPLYYLNKLSNIFNINIDYLVDLSDKMIIDFNKKDINRINLGQKIKSARKEINYTQEKLAKKLNTTHCFIFGLWFI